MGARVPVHRADNFGFMTVTMDTLFRTVKHPKADALAKSRGELPMPESELRRSAELSTAILEKRGASALASDDAAGEGTAAAARASERAGLTQRRPILAGAASAAS